LPIVQGRSFENLSSLGLKVLVNIANALAHHETAIKLNLPLPGLLIIDGPSSNIGHEGEGLERIESIYGYLIDVCQRLGDRLQILVVDNDVPPSAAQYMRLALEEDSRLIPREDLEAARGQ
jgi:hypothetical protein